MKIGDEVYVHGYIDEIRSDVVIIRNEGGYFGTVPSEVGYPCERCKHWWKSEDVCLLDDCQYKSKDEPQIDNLKAIRDFQEHFGIKREPTLSEMCKTEPQTERNRKMSKWVDTEWLKENYTMVTKKYSGGIMECPAVLLETIEEAPSIDIVFCHDCEFENTRKYPPHRMGLIHDESDYCSYGIRKTDDVDKHNEAVVALGYLIKQRKEQNNGEKST